MERMESLTENEIKTVINYGEMVNIKVTRLEWFGRPAVWFQDSAPYTDYYKAMRAIQAIKNEVCAGVAA